MTFKRPSNMSIQAYLNESDKRFFKTKFYGTVMLDDILAYRLLKSANLSICHEELVKATVPHLQYDIIKDQLKETFSDASRQTATKSDENIKTEEASMAQEINHLSFQESYHQNELSQEKEYNPFGHTPNQLSTGQDHATYYTRGNHRNYQEKPNPMNTPYQDNNRPRISPTFKRQQHNRTGKNSCARNVIQLRCNIFESIYHMAQNLKNVIYNIHKKSFFFSQISTILNRSKTWRLSLCVRHY